MVVILAGVIAAVARATGSIDEFGNLDPNSAGAALAGFLYLGLIIPHLAVSVRRLHDSGRLGWFLLLGLIPCIGAMVLLVFYVSAGDPGLNKYGPPPGSAIGPPSRLTCHAMSRPAVVDRGCDTRLGAVVRGESGTPWNSIIRDRRS